jgi:ABC-type antimicrobial peptide transport system permease subunit
MPRSEPVVEEPALPISRGLWATVLNRSRADWPVLFASWVLLASAIALLSAGNLYTDAVTLAGLHRELRQAAPADRAVVVRTQILSDRLAQADGAITPQLTQLLSATGGDLAREVRSGPFANADVNPDAVTRLLVFASIDGIRDHGTLADGRWPDPGRSPVEVAVSQAAARILGVKTGDTIDLVGRLDGTPVQATVTGTWAPDPADPYWLADPLVLSGTETGGSFTTVGPLVADQADITGPLAGGRPVDASWRAIPSIEGFRPDNLDEVASEVDGLKDRISAALPGSNQAAVTTRLPDILASVDRSVLVTQSGILLLLVQFGVLAGYAVVLVAALLLERRRTEIALLRARGAGYSHLLRMSLYESVLVVVPAVLVAPWLATLLVAAVGLSPALAGVGLEAPLPGPSTFAVAVGVGLLSIVALVIPTLVSGVSIAGVRASVGRQVGRTLPQRLGLDLALVALAAIALFQLRLYGAPLTRQARGSLGVDPLLVAAPAIGLLAGAVLAIRIVPRLAELAERVLGRGRGLVPALGGRQVARRPLRYTRAALLLVLAAALGTFASAHAATWTTSQADQAAFSAGADVRVDMPDAPAIPDWATGDALRALPGVTAATPIVNDSVSVGTAVRDATLLGVDGAALADVVRLRDGADRDATIAALKALPANRDTTEAAAGVPIPDGTKRLSVLLDADLAALEGFKPIKKGYEGIHASAVILDGDGRLNRIDGSYVPVDAKGSRSEIPLTTPDGVGAFRGPLRLVGLDVGISVDSDDPDSVAGGPVTVRGIGTSPDADGGTWTDTPVTQLSGRWIQEDPFSPRGTYIPKSPGKLEVAGIGRQTQTGWSLQLGYDTPPTVPAGVNQAFLDKAAAHIGDTIGAQVVGLPVQLKLVGRVDGFPSQAPSKPLVVADGASLALATYAGGATLDPTHEWWISAKPGASEAIAATVADAPFSAVTVVDRTALQATLTGDPLGLGVIGILGLGSIAALVFAAVGFLVTTTVSTQERLGELALLKALGVAPRQLLSWLTAEGAALLFVGLVAGVGLGLVLAWLALPFATLTASGEAPVPAPVVVVPPDALVPTVILAVVLLLATVVLVGRILPGARTSAVLRARDE